MSHHPYVSPIREPLILGADNYHQLTEDIIKPIENKPTKLWWMGFIVSAMVAAFGVFTIGWEIWYGTGTWNLNRTINWGWDITNFVWWIGIGHAGTLISAILLLFRQKWRTGVNRAAEAMTIFAVICAGIYPIFHMGRVWLMFFIMPYPNSRGPLWTNFTSPLLWDVFAISTYFSVSVLFWYLGLLPDLATVRDRAKASWAKKLYTKLSFGWSGEAKHWQRHEAVSLVLAGLSTPLVLSVHTIVSFDFATSVIPGWHTTIFPPYFVAGAIFSGFAMVLTLVLVVRKVMNLENYITLAHIESMNKVIVLTGSIVGVAYITEIVIALFYSANIYEYYAFYNRTFGPYAWSYWGMMTCNVISPQFFWIKKLRRSILFTFFMSIFINIGMWFERFVIIVTSLHRDYLPSSWAYYFPSWVEIGMFCGTLGIFMTSFLLFAKFMPVIALAEVKSILKLANDKHLEKTKLHTDMHGHGVTDSEMKKHIHGMHH